MMYLLDAQTALDALLSLLMLPAAVMIGIGGFFWDRGATQQNEDRVRKGKMLIMFGAILLVILLVCSWFLNSQISVDA
jgi:succinate dehydrogenase/fumarate reductase cytochrome b subunit